MASFSLNSADKTARAFRIFINVPVSSLETYAQANARVHRSGQKHKCTVVQLQGSDAEKHVYRLLDNRIDIHTKITDLYKEILD